MTPSPCVDAQEAIEAIASGEAAPAPLAAHVAACARCAASLELATRLDRLLEDRPAPPPPGDFTARVLGRVRRERWRAEQYVDLGFNVAVAAGVVLIVGGIWLVLNRAGFSAATAEAAALLAAALDAIGARIEPRLPTYLAAAGLLLTTLGLWWWADRRVSL
jgi:hypothetical protein